MCMMHDVKEGKAGGIKTLFKDLIKQTKQLEESSHQF